MSAFSSILALLFAALIFAGVWIYNRLVRQRNLVSEAWAGIDVQLQKRHELVPNLVATVRGYAKHESSLFEEIARERGAAVNGVAETGESETRLSGSITRLFALAEDYPDLKANEGFQQLHSSLVRIENDLQFARRYYNGAVRDNNNMVESVPSNLVATLFGFQSVEFFEIELASARMAPDVALYEND
ncbi:MAG: LemA family protein [Xanthomonadales bacterium]|nr:LemA family protein [Gammaproteobacteria bacterium]NNL95350.1 LemA family protein [Xanthomonadales bacterium]